MYNIYKNYSKIKLKCNNKSVFSHRKLAEIERPAY
jgi:hypothetical protein